MQVMNQYEQGPLTEKSECLYISREGKRYQENTRILREQKIDIIINEKLILHTMCTPQYLTEAVLGRLRTEGIIEKVDEIEKIHIGNDGKIATITMKNDAWNEKQCKKLSPVSPVKWKEEWIFHLEDILAEGMPLHNETWGTHSCFLAKEGKVIFACEDIGRHNAIDKVVGYALLHEIDLKKCMLYSSGRMPSDMAEKVIRAGIPIAVCKAVPTAEAVELAKKYRLTLICAARPDRIRAYVS